MDPLIGQAAQRIGLSSQELFRLLPSELTLWVDPYEVSYRIGEDGSICVLYEASPAGGSTQNSTNVQMVHRQHPETPMSPFLCSTLLSTFLTKDNHFLTFPFIIYFLSMPFLIL